METEGFPFGYRLYGLRVAADRAQPGLAPLTTTQWPSCDFLLTFLADAPIPAQYGDLPWRLMREYSDGEIITRISAAALSGGFAHRYCLVNEDDYIDVIALPAASLVGEDSPKPNVARIEVYWQDLRQPADDLWYNIANYVYDVILSYILRWYVPATLHGSVLSKQGSAFALVGPSGAGKSTLSAALLSAGYAMLADDHVAIWPRQGDIWVEPGTPRVRLWPASLALVNAGAEELPRVYTFIEKRHIHLDARLINLDAGIASASSALQFQESALPLCAIYLLAPRQPQRSQALVERIPQKLALRELWATRDTRLSLSPKQSASELAILAQVAQQLPVFHLHRPDGLHTLPLVVEAIAADLASLPN